MRCRRYRSTSPDMSIKDIISYAMEASLFALVMSVGLQSRWTDVVHVLRRPALLLRALLAVNVIVPLVAISLCFILPIAPWTKAGLVMMAVSPGAPFVPLKMLKGGAERSYVVGVYVALMLAAILIVPITAAILKPVAPQGVMVPVPLVAAFVIETVFVPLVVGLLVHSWSESLGKRAAPIMRKAAFLILLPAVVLIFIRFSRDFLGLIGDGTLLVIAASVAAGLAAGFILGGPDAASRNALGDAASTRHPGLAAAISQLHSNDTRVLAAIVLYLFASMAFSAAFTRILSSTGTRPLRAADLTHQ